MHVTLVNPPTLFREVPVDQIALHDRRESYYRQILRLDQNPLADGTSSLPGEHLGIQSLASVARDAGHVVDLVNGCVRLDESLASTLARIPRETDLVGLTGTGDLIGEMLLLCRGLRDRGYDGPIIVGHEYASLNDARLLQQYTEIDFVIRGPGENALIELLDVISRPEQTAGEHKYPDAVSFRRADGSVRSGELRPAALSPTTPLPSRDDLSTVVSLGMSPAMYTKRGCVYRCSFCTTGSLPAPVAHGYSSSFKDPQTAATEFEELAQRSGSNHITIVDDLFVGRDIASRTWATEFAESLIEMGSTTTWMADVRVDSVTPNLFSVLRRAGLTRVFVGVEAASPRVLRSYTKRYSRSTITSAMATLDELGIETLLGYIMFSPFESLDGVLENIGLLTDVRQDDYQLLLQQLRLYPGTALERQLSQAGLLRGTFPHYGYDFQDERVGILACAVSEMGAQIREHELQPLARERGVLFRLLSQTIQEMVACLRTTAQPEQALSDLRHQFLDQLPLTAPVLDSP